MNQTTEEIIAAGALDRIKSIIQNGDFWGSPGAAKTSADALGGLLSFSQAFGATPKPAKQPTVEEAVEVAKELLREVGELPEAKPVKEKPAKPEPKQPDGQAPTTDA